MFFNDPFKYVPVSNLAEISDKFTRNEIMSTNEIRQIIGMKPSEDPKADELRNKNLNRPEGEAPQVEETPDEHSNEVEQNSATNADDIVQLF